MVFEIEVGKSMMLAFLKRWVFVFAVCVITCGASTAETSTSRTREKRDYERQVKKMRERLKEKHRKEREATSLKMVEELRRLGFRAKSKEPEAQKEKAKWLKKLRSVLPQERAEAAWWVGIKRVDEATLTLIRLLKDKDEWVRSHAVFALGRLGVNHMGPRFYVMLERDESIEVKGRAAEALGRFDYRRALPLLLEALRSRDARLKIGALEGLSWMSGDKPRSAVLSFSRHEDPLIRMKVATALGRMRKDSVKSTLLQLLKDSESNVVAAAVKSSEKLGVESAVPRLKQLLNSENEEVVSASISALVSLGAVGSLKELRELLFRSKGKGLVGAETALALARLGGDLPASEFRSLLNSDDNRVLVRALRAAGLGGLRWTEEFLRGLCKNTHPPLRREAALALGRLEAYESIPVLMELIKDPNDQVRVSAIAALSRLGGSRTLPACAILLKDNNPLVAAAAARCVAMLAKPDWDLASSTGKRLAQMLRLDAEPMVAAAVADALGSIGVKGNRRGFIRLMRLTLHKEAECRAGAVHALGRLGSDTWRQSTPAVKRLLERDPSTKVRLTAALGAAKMGLRDLFPVLQGLYRKQIREGDEAEKLRAIMALALFNNEWLSKFEERFIKFVNKRPNTLQKMQVIRLVGDLKEPWVEKLLRAVKESPNALVRAEARRVLGEKPPVERVPFKVEKTLDKEKSIADGGVAPKVRQEKEKLKREEYSGPFPMNQGKEEHAPDGCFGCGCVVGGRSGGDGSNGLIMVFLLFSLLVVLKRDMILPS